MSGGKGGLGLGGPGSGSPSLGISGKGGLGFGPGAAGARAQALAKLNAPQGGLSGFLDNLGHEAEGAISGLPMGVVRLGETLGKPIYDAGNAIIHGRTFNAQESRDATAAGNVVPGIAKSFAHTYSPLLHGQFDKFGHELYMHPLGPILDAATIATLGAGGVARAGEMMSKAGLISDASRLAHLREATDLTVPSFGTNERIFTKRTTGPVLSQLRQQATHNLLGKLPPETPMIGTTARGVRALQRVAQKTGARLDVQAGDFNKAFNALTKPEKAAWHLKARALNPDSYAAFLREQEVSSPGMLKILADPKVKALVETPTPALRTALDQGRALSDRLTQHRVTAGHIDPVTAVESPYRHLRLLKGAKAGENGLEGGPSVEQLMKQIDATGGEHPFHLPDSARTPGIRSAFANKPSGYAAPVQGVKQSRMILASQGRINPFENALGRDFARYRDQAQAQMLHDELVKHAAMIPKGDPIPPGWDELKLYRGQSGAPFTTRTASALERELTPPSIGDRVRQMGHVETPRTVSGQFDEAHRLVVPAQVRRLVESESRSYTTRLAAIRRIPMSAWKMSVLGLRPAFFANITIGNSILGTLQMAPGRWGFASWLNQVVPGSHILGDALTADTMREVLPEQATGTFAESVTPHGYTGSSKLLRGANRAAHGIAPQTIAYENVLRRAMAEGWARAEPSVQRLLDHNGGDINAALRQVAKTDPRTLDTISRRVDDALGNYRTYNRFERAIKQVVPFYGWNRHITKSLFRLASERPQVLDALLNTGEQGRAQADKILGLLPDYLQEAVPVHLPSWLGGQTGPGITQTLVPSAWNPFGTLIDEGKILAAPAQPAGWAGSAVPLAPDISALIGQLTGKSLFTGGSIKGNALVDALLNAIPQESLFTRAGPKPTSINQNSRYAQLLRLLGLPVENLNLPAAHDAANTRWITIPTKK